MNSTSFYGFLKFRQRPLHVVSSHAQFFTPAGMETTGDLPSIFPGAAVCYQVCTYSCYVVVVLAQVVTHTVSIVVIARSLLEGGSLYRYRYDRGLVRHSSHA